MGDVGEIGENSSRPRREMDDIGEIGENVISSRSVNIQNRRVMGFVFCKLRNVLGRMGCGFGFGPHRWRFIANVSV